MDDVRQRRRAADADSRGDVTEVARKEGMDASLLFSQKTFVSADNSL